MNVFRIFHVAQKLDEISDLMHELLRKVAIMSGTIDALSQQVAQSTQVEQSAVILIQGLAQQLADAGNDPQKLDDLRNQLNNSAQQLAAAVAANTSSPIPQPQPTPPSPATNEPSDGADSTDEAQP